MSSCFFHTSAFRTCLMLLGLAMAAAAPAATEFENGLVPMEVVRDFAGGKVYRSLPDGFPPVSLPAGIDLRLSGSTSEGYSQKVVLRTSLSREVLNEQLRAALTQQGWLDVSNSRFGGSMRLCHDQYGALYINVNSVAGSADNKVEVSRSSFPSSTTCSEELANAVASANWYNFYNERFPILELPPGTLESPRPSILRGGSTNYDASGHVEIDRDGNIEVPATTVAAVHEHFSEQMLEQGWQADSSSAGERSATSVWTRTLAAPAWSDTEVTMVVALTIIRGAGAVYGVSLTLQSLPVAGTGGLGVIGVYPF